MATARDVVAGAATITKIPLSTLISIQRRLTETGIWPAARGQNVPNLTTKHVVYFILAILADAKGKDMAASARAYYGLQNANGHRLGDVLCNLLDSFAIVPSDSSIAALTYKSQLEVDCASPRACLRLHCDDGIGEDIFGIQTKPWRDIAVRKSMTIGGSSLFQFAIGTLHNHWETDTIGV